MHGEMKTSEESEGVRSTELSETPQTQQTLLFLRGWALMWDCDV